MNLVSRALAVATDPVLVFVYTLGLRRCAAQNVVWGGAAGCIPVLVGWAAVTGTIGWQTNQLYAGVRRGESVKPLRLFLQSNN